MIAARFSTNALKVALFVVPFMLCLFGSSPLFYSDTGKAGITGFMALFTNPETQWIAYSSLALYFAGFLWLRSRFDARPFLRADNPNLWLLGVLLMGSVNYALDYSTSSKTLWPVILLTGATAGQAAGMALSGRRPQPGGLLPLFPGMLVVAFTVAAFWHPELEKAFQYRGQLRWSGPWKNPNLFGLLMAVGLLSIFGLALQIRERAAADIRSRTRQAVLIALLSLAALAMVAGLVRSYSRGAWVAMAIGFGYFCWEIFRLRHFTNRGVPQWAIRHWPSIVTFLAAIFLLVFWNYRHSERLVVRRALSIGNRNDFSWRNRVAAWEGSLQMMTDRPLRGFGWDRPVVIYNEYYRTSRVTEAQAIEMNDYFSLGTILGLPALACFGVCIGLHLGRAKGAHAGRRTSEDTPGAAVSRVDLAKIACRAGAVVLLAGFWFDGGLFKVPTAITFWVLLELGSARMAESEGNNNE